MARKKKRLTRRQKKKQAAREAKETNKSHHWTVVEYITALDAIPERPRIAPTWGAAFYQSITGMPAKVEKVYSDRVRLVVTATGSLQDFYGRAHRWLKGDTVCVHLDELHEEWTCG